MPGTACAATPSSSSTATLKVLVLNAWHGGTRIPGGVGMIADITRESGASLVFIPEATETTPDIVARLNASGLDFQQRMTGDTAILSAYPVGKAAALPGMTKAIVTIETVEMAAYAAHLEYRWYATYLPRGYGPGVPRGEFSEYGWGRIPSGPVTHTAAVGRVNEDSGRPQVITQFIADAYRLQYPAPATHPGFTWPAGNPQLESNELTWAPEADERDRIDFVFHHPDHRLRLTDAQLVGPRESIVRNQRVVESGEDSFVPADMPWPTDHKGVLAIYTVQGKGCAPELAGREI